MQLLFQSLEDSNGLLLQGFKLNLRKYFLSPGTVGLWNARLRTAGMFFFGNGVGGNKGGGVCVRGRNKSI